MLGATERAGVVDGAVCPRNTLEYQPLELMFGVSTDRIKGSSRRWDFDNAEAMMTLEALSQNIGLWDKYWASALCHLINVIPGIRARPLNCLNQDHS